LADMDKGGAQIFMVQIERCHRIPEPGAVMADDR
jgi:hypothetical protein